MILFFRRKIKDHLSQKKKNLWEYDIFYRFGKDVISFFLQIWYSEKMIFIPREYDISYDRKTIDNKIVSSVK